MDKLDKLLKEQEIEKIHAKALLCIKKLDKLLEEQYPEQKEKYDIEKVQEEMMRLIREEAVDKLVTKTFDTERE